MACKVTGSVNGRNCTYTISGARLLRIANWFPAVELTGPIPSSPGEVPVAGQIGYRRDTDGFIISIVLPPDEELYNLPVADQSLNYLDATLKGANDATYRQHTVNAVLDVDPVNLLPQQDALALGRFVGFVTRKDGVIKVLGRKNGLKAPANGADDNSGTAEADSSGFIVIMQGTSDESAPIVESESVLVDAGINAIVVTP